MRVLAVLSGKGGVGKTTTVANLGAALAARGSRVVAVDMNWTTPNLGYHLGVDAPTVPLDEVLAGRGGLEGALQEVAPRLRCLLPAPGAPLEAPRERLAAFFRSVRALEADWALLDCSPGLEPVRTLLPHADGALVVTNPELPAMADALITIRQAREAHPSLDLRTELNRARWGLPGAGEVARLCGAPVAAVIPESRAVSRSIASGRPAVASRPWSRPSRVFLRVAAALVRGSPALLPDAFAPRRPVPLGARLESLHRRVVESSVRRRSEVSALLASLEDYRSRGLLSEEAYQELRRVNLARLGPAASA
ncbi:MAG: P-loop NTPase [Halobacteria archaeon]